MTVVAITRRVKSGHEDEFEERIQEFFRDALSEPGATGASLIRPVKGSTSNDYGILRTFVDEEARDAFYASEAFAEWKRAVEPLVEGEAERRELHGLEAFFRGDAAPPAWKMATVTWLAVNPAVYASAQAVHAVTDTLPSLVELLVVNGLVVSLLTWVLMPLLTRLFRPWLNPGETK